MANYQNQNQLLEETKAITDSLDDLPTDVIQNIFAFVPIKDAIVASTVSSRYQRLWHHSCQFLFGRDLSVRYDQYNLASIVDHLFALHEGDKIKTFKLYIDPIGIEVLLKNWLQICTQKDLEDLELHLYQPGFIIEFSFFNALNKLKTLKLIHCVIELPKVPSGLQFLQTLSLCSLHITEGMFDMLIKHCKMLQMIDLINCSTIKKLNLIARDNKHFKKLRIANCQNLEEIEIDSPTLQSIFYHGNFLKVQISQRIQLYEASFYFKPSKSFMISTQLEALVINDLSHVSILTTTSLLIESVATRMRDGVFREAQYCFVNLRELQLFMDGTKFCNPYDITMFIKNCPSMVKLFIDLHDYQFNLGMYWEIHQKPVLDKCNHKFAQLKVVVLRSFKFLPFELELVKIILQKAIILEKLILIPPKIKGRCKFKKEDKSKYEQLFSSWRASTKAIVKFHEKYVEKSFVNPTHKKCWFTNDN